MRHGRPLVDQSRPPHEWSLDPTYADDVRALRARLPVEAAWFSSPEPKAVATARLLTERDVHTVDGLREHERLTTDWMDDFEDVVLRAFQDPDQSAYPGWEPLSRTRRRVVEAVGEILREHRALDVVLVGHGTAWTLVRSAVRREPPDVAWWARLAMPDLASFAEVGDMLAP